MSCRLAAAASATLEGPGSAAAAYHFPDLDPPRTTAAFASVDDVGIVERAALGLP